MTVFLIGDLWSFNYQNNEYVVSPVPDVSVQELDPAIHRCLVLGSDGLWNVMTAETAAALVADLEYHFEYKVIHDPVWVHFVRISLRLFVLSLIWKFMIQRNAYI